MIVQPMKNDAIVIKHRDGKALPIPTPIRCIRKECGIGHERAGRRLLRNDSNIAVVKTHSKTIPARQWNWLPVLPEISGANEQLVRARVEGAIRKSFDLTNGVWRSSKDVVNIGPIHAGI